MAVSKRQIKRKVTKLSKQKKFQYDIFKKICRLQCRRLSNVNTLSYVLLPYSRLSLLRAHLCYKLYGRYFLENFKLLLMLLNFACIVTLRSYNTTIVKLSQMLYIHVITLSRFCAVNITAGHKYFKLDYLNAQCQIIRVVPPHSLNYYPTSALVINAILRDIELRNFCVFNATKKCVLVLNLKWDRLLWSYNVKALVYKNWSLFKYQRNFDNQFFFASPFRTKFFILKTWLWKAYVQQFFLWIRAFFFKLKHLYLVLNKVTSITYKFSWVYHYGFWKLLKLLKCGVATKWALINIVIPFKHAGFFVVLHHFLPKIPEQEELSIIYSDLYFNIWRLSVTTRLLSTVGKSKLVMLGLNQKNKNLLQSVTFFLHRRSYHNDFFHYQPTSVLFFSCVIRAMTKFNLLNYCIPRSMSRFFINFTILFAVNKLLVLELLSATIRNGSLAAFLIFQGTRMIPKILFLFMTVYEYVTKELVLSFENAGLFSLTLAADFALNNISRSNRQNVCNFQKQLFNLGTCRIQRNLSFYSKVAGFYTKKLFIINILDSSLINKFYKQKTVIK